MADSKNVLNATDQNFDSSVLQSKELALVDFWAEWCGPCRTLGPTIDQLADDYNGKVRVFKMNVDNNPDTPNRYHVRGIPTVMLFKNGELVGQFVGLQSKDVFVEAIQKHL